MAGSHRSLWLLLLGAALSVLHFASAAVTVTVPPKLWHTMVSITIPFNEGSLIQNSTGMLFTATGAAWRFLTLEKPMMASIDYGALLHTPYVENAQCLYGSVSSNYSTVDMFLSTQAGINATWDPKTGRSDVSLAYRLLGTSINRTRSSSELVLLNGGTGPYTLGILNSGGQTKDHAAKNSKADTLVTYRLGAYEFGSSVCDGARKISSGSATSTPSPGMGQTLAMADDDIINAQEARMITAFQNASCVAFQLQGLLYTYQSNGSALVSPQSIERDMTVFLTSATDAAAWARGSFVNTPSLQAPMCRQISQPAPDSSANATAIFGVGSTAPFVNPVSGNVTVTAHQTCQIVADDLDPRQQYVLWAVNGMESSNVSTSPSRVKWAARAEGSCASLQFNSPLTTGQPLPPGAEQAEPEGPVAAPMQPEALLAPLGAPRPAADAPLAANVPLPPLTGRAQAPARAPAFPVYSVAPGPSPSEEPFKPARIINLIPSPPPPPGQPPGPPPSVSVDPSSSSSGAAAKGTFVLSSGAIAGIVVGGLVGMAATGVAGFVLGQCSAARKIAKAAKEDEKPSFYGVPQNSKAGSLDGQAGPGATGGSPHFLKSWTAASEEPPGAFRFAPPGLGDSSSSGRTSGGVAAASQLGEAAAGGSAFPAHSGPPAVKGAAMTAGLESFSDSANDGWQIPGEEIEYVVNAGQPVLLGSGSFGRVYKARLGRVQDVAVKEIRRELDPGERERLQQHLFGEIALLRRCRHRNIVTFKGISYKDGHVLLVMEEMATDLFHALKLAGSPFTWRGGRGQEVLLGIAQGLAYLHWRKTIHFDLKSANVLLTRAGEAKITDVGLSQVLAPGHTHLNQQQGYTLPWAAPEVLLNLECKPSADIYSFGVVLWEVVTGGIPRRGQLRTPRVPEECPAEVFDLWKRCMSEDPKLRPDTADIVHLLEQI